MQQINTERQQTNGRLARQLPANLIEQTTSPSHQKHVKKNATTLPNQFEQITGVNQSKSPLKHLQTDQADFDTYRSLSTCPTYSSLSRHSNETRDCATQITTLPPVEPITQDISPHSLLSIDDNPVEAPVNEVVLMPISSGFNDYPFYYLDRSREHDNPQFRDNQQEKQNPGPKSKSKSKSNGKLPPARPTAVKRSPRSETFVLSAKRQTVDPKVPKTKPVPSGTRRPPLPPKEQPTKKPTPPPPPPQRRRLEPEHRNGSTRPLPRYSNSSVDPQDLGRRPVRFADRRNPAYHSSSPSLPPVHYQKPAPPPRDPPNRSRHVRVADQDYIIEHRRPTPVEYVYDDYHRETPVERNRPQRRVRVVREAAYPDDGDDDVYYVKSNPSRRTRQPPPPPEYVYSERIPTRIRPRGSNIVYVDEYDRPVEYHDDYVYIDEDGNEVEFVDERSRSPEYVEYIYEDERDQRRSHKPKVIYVDEEPPIRTRKSSKHPSSTRIVYD